MCRIETTDGHLAATLANADNYTEVFVCHVLNKQSLALHILQVTLQTVNNNDTSQGWIFCPV